MRRDFVAHERWMIRSFALTFAAVILRIYLPFAGDLVTGYTAIAWLCWIPNLVVAKIWIRLRERPCRAAPA